MQVKRSVIPALAEKRELPAGRRLNWVVTPSVGPFAGRAVFSFYNKILREMRRQVMAKDKKMVEAITSMDEDFAQWYTDVVKKAELVDYSSVKIGRAHV